MKKYSLVLMILLFSSLSFAAGENEGKTGLSFLKVGIDARAIGMGEAYTALASDASATYWNPAGLVNTKYSNVLFNHNEWIEDIRGEYAAISFVRQKSAWAFHIRSFNIDDIQVRTIPSEDPLEKTSAHYLSTGLSYSHRLHKDLDFGATIKCLYEKIYHESASGFAVDFGMIYRSPLSDLQFGAVIQNLGKMNEFRDEVSDLPVITRLGFLYHLPLNYKSFSAKFTVDLVNPSQENTRLHLGTELLLWDQLALRCGIFDGYESRSFSFGAGIMRSAIRLDYALAPFDDDLGSTHRFSVNFIL